MPDTPPTASAKQKRGRPPWLETLAVLGVKIVVAGLRLIPLRPARAMARGLGSIVFLCCGPNFAHVGRNLEITFGPDLDPKRKKAIARGFWRHVFQGAVEAAHLKTWTSDNCKSFVDTAELFKLETLKASKSGVILVSGHLGSWEIGPYALALLGYPIHLVQNTSTMAPLLAYLESQRKRSGMQVLGRHDHPWKYKKRLDGGAWVTIAADLNAKRHKGSFVPFFGTQASTYLSPAALQQATHCPIVVGSTARQPDGRHRFHIWKIIEYQASDDRDAAIHETMHSIHHALEEAITSYPEQWLWTYRRWKTRPKGEIHSANGLPPQCNASNTGNPKTAAPPLPPST